MEIRKFVVDIDLEIDISAYSYMVNTVLPFRIRELKRRYEVLKESKYSEKYIEMAVIEYKLDELKKEYSEKKEIYMGLLEMRRKLDDTIYKEFR